MTYAEIYRTIRDFQRALISQEAQMTAEMAQRWRVLERNLSASLDDLAQEIARRQAAGEALKPSQIIRMDRYQALLRQVQTEIANFEQYAGRSISAGQLEALKLGLNSAQSALGVAKMQFDFLPVQAFRNMVGVCADGKTLFSLLAKRALTPDSVSGLTDALIKATALGINPRETARAMANGLAQGLDKALVIARTEQIRVYREAARSQYEKAGVSQYIRHCAFQDRTCIACIALDGKIYPTEDIMDSHPNCRCFCTPIIPGLRPVGRAARDWFDRLPADQQRQIFGSETKYKLWQDGTPLEDFATIKNDPTWGPTIRQTTIKELTGE